MRRELHFIIKQTFVDLVFLPCLSRGRVEDMLIYIDRTDPDLRCWLPLLSACAQLLEGRNNVRLLLSIQVPCLHAHRACVIVALSCS